MFKKEITVGADVKNLEAVTAFVDECLEQFDCPLRAQMQLDVAVDELFSNMFRAPVMGNGGEYNAR